MLDQLPWAIDYEGQAAFLVIRKMEDGEYLCAYEPMDTFNAVITTSGSLEVSSRLMYEVLEENNLVPLRYPSASEENDRDRSERTYEPK